jgi:hypothetical protein
MVAQKFLTVNTIKQAKRTPLFLDAGRLPKSDREKQNGERHC